MKDIEQLKQVYLEALRLQERAKQELIYAAREAYRFKAGDLVAVNGQRGRITEVSVLIYPSFRGDGLNISLEPIIYPLKKDGTVSQKNRIYTGGRFEEYVTFLERPATETCTQ